MRDVFFTELKKSIEEIRKSESARSQKDLTEGCDLLIGTVDRMCELSLLARKGGLIALEEVTQKLDDFPGGKHLKQMLLGVVDGIDPDLLEEMMFMRYCTASLCDYEALQYLIVMYGTLSIQSGMNPRVLEEALICLLPEEVAEEYEERKIRKEEAEKSNSPGAIDAARAEQIDRICSDEISSEITPGDEYYYIVKLLEEVCVRMDDRSMQRILREIDSTDLVCAMKLLGGRARRKIFDNMSERLAGMIAEDFAFAGPVRMIDAGDACKKMLCIFLKLVDTGEIAYDDDVLVKGMASIFLHKQELSQNEEIKEAESDLHRLWKEYQEHSYRRVGKKR